METTLASTESKVTTLLKGMAVAVLLCVLALFISFYVMPSMFGCSHNQTCDDKTPTQPKKH